jgi:hypothetical protein
VVAAVQTISLLGYLYEAKHNFGPHLIIVPLACVSCCSSALCRT